MLSGILLGVLAALIVGLLIFIHESGHFWMARWCGMRVDKFSIGFGPALLKTKRGETTYQLSALPLGGYVQIAGLTPPEEGQPAPDPRDPGLYQNHAAWKRFLVVFAGPAINYVFASLVFLVLFLMNGVPQVVLSYVEPNSPAAQAGLQVGDVIHRIDGGLLRTSQQLINVVPTTKGKVIHLDVVRAEQHRTVEVQATWKEGAWRIGVGSGRKPHHESVWISLREALVWPGHITMLLLHELKGLFSLKFVETAKNFQGPLGMISSVKGQIRDGIWSALDTMARVSALLGCMNLLPLPALDGGRLVFLAWELVTRRPVPQRLEQGLQIGSVVFLLLILVVVSIKDIWAWFH